MSEFLHHLVANREYRQHDRELHIALREQMRDSYRAVFNFNNDPWVAEEQDNG